MSIKSKRINTGIYEFKIQDRTFELEQFPDKSWLLFEMVNGDREYIRDFMTKGFALEWAEKILKPCYENNT